MLDQEQQKDVHTLQPRDAHMASKRTDFILLLRLCQLKKIKSRDLSCLRGWDDAGGVEARSINRSSRVSWISRVRGDPAGVSATLFTGLSQRAHRDARVCVFV